MREPSPEQRASDENEYLLLRVEMATSMLEALPSRFRDDYEREYSEPDVIDLVADCHPTDYRRAVGQILQLWRKHIDKAA
jgi:hypothetical protein